MCQIKYQEDGFKKYTKIQILLPVSSNLRFPRVYIPIRWSFLSPPPIGVNRQTLIRALVICRLLIGERIAPPRPIFALFEPSLSTPTGPNTPICLRGGHVQEELRLLDTHRQVVGLHLRILPPLLRHVRVVRHPLQLRKLCLHLVDCALDRNWVEHHPVHLCLVRYEVVLLLLVERQYSL